MTAITEIKPNDKKPKKLTKAEETAEHDKQLLAYLEERMLNLTQQIRALAIAAKISPESFWQGFIDDQGQDQFYIRLHAQEDLHNAGVNQQLAQTEALKKLSEDLEKHE